jgi:hypothetical protein
MVPQISLLVLLVDLIDAIPSPTVRRRRGRPPTYPERLFLKALVIMLVRDVATVDGLLAILDQPTRRCGRCASACRSMGGSHRGGRGSGD